MKEYALNSKLFILFVFTLFLIAFTPQVVLSQPQSPITPPLRSAIPSYRFVADADDASALFVNPAGLAVRDCVSNIIHGSYTYNHLDELSIAFTAWGFGLGYSRQEGNLFQLNSKMNHQYSSNTYMLGAGFSANRLFHIGTSLRWHHTGQPRNGSPFTMDLGFLSRPSRWLSIGGVWRNTNTPRFLNDRLEDTFTGGISIRPLTERLTLSAQGTFADGKRPVWQAGGRMNVLRGVEIFGSYTEDLSWENGETYREFSAGVALTLDNIVARTSTRSRRDWDSEYSGYSFSLEGTGSYVKNSIYHPEKFAEITLSGKYLDEGGGFVLLGDDGKNLGSALRELESIRNDNDIKGLLIKVGSFEQAFIGPVSANLCEIRDAIEDITEKDKPVVAYLERGGSAAEFYIASAADMIIAPEKSTIGMIGVALEIHRLKRLFAKLGVEWDHTTAGDYKSTFHTIYTDTTSTVQEEELRSLVKESYRLLVEAIAEGRGMSYREMSKLADGRIFDTAEAVRLGLIDKTGWEKDARNTLKDLAGDTYGGEIHTVSVRDRNYWKERWKPAPAVAVVGAYGSIESGKSERNMLRGGRTMGSKTVIKQLQAASDHPGVKAIVLRVDSGGGSALASDEILHQIERIRNEKKIPVIISMSNVAGSGGYWISMYGDAIFADPFTITGSIGVVFFKPVLEQLYHKTGITHEVFKVGEHSDAISTGRKFTPEEHQMLDQYVNRIYESFIEKVARGRKMDAERVREIAGGRIYFGTQARELNLVDRLGGLKDAVEYAACSAGIEDDYRRVYFSAFPGGIIADISRGVTMEKLQEYMKKLRLGGRDLLDEVITIY